MKRINSIVVVLLLLVLFACNKREPVKSGPKEIPLEMLYKQFNFKVGSFWILKNIATTIVDTLRVVKSEGLKVDTTGPEGHNSPCINYSERFSVEFSHKMFPEGMQNFTSWTNNGWFRLGVSGPHHVIFKGNAGDSLFFRSPKPGTADSTFTTKIEAIFDSLTIQQETYSTVYQMRYSPQASGFARIWWCPNVGIVKLEFRNSQTKNIENWELVEFNAHLH